MWRLWRKSLEGQTVLESSKKNSTVVSQRKERARMVCKRRSPEGQNWAGRGRASEEVRSMVKRAQKVGCGTCCQQQGRWGCRWHVLASRRWIWGWRVIIDSVAAAQNWLVNISHGLVTVITMVRIQTVDQDEQTEKQWRCVDPCKSHHHKRWKNQGNESFDRMKVSWWENRVVIRIAVLLVNTGMALFVSRNRRKKSCQRIKTWMYLSSQTSPKQLGVTCTFDTTLSYIPVPPMKAATLLNTVGQLSYLFHCVGWENGRRERAVSLDSQWSQCAKSRYLLVGKKCEKRPNKEPLPYQRKLIA